MCTILNYVYTRIILSSLLAASSDCIHNETANLTKREYYDHAKAQQRSACYAFGNACVTPVLFVHSLFIYIDTFFFLLLKICLSAVRRQ